MTFWIIAILLSLSTAALLALALLRPGRDANGAQGPEDVGVYRDQLTEIDRDLARGVIDASEAARVRTEVARRLLAADRQRQRPRQEAPRALSLAAAVLSVAVLAGGGLWLYDRLGAPGYPDLPLSERLAASAALREQRPSQSEAEASWAALQPPAAPADVPEDYLRMVEQLRALVPARPDDLEGWRLLARHEGALGNAGAAARAQGRVVAIQGADARVGDLVTLADLMVAAAGGFVSPETQAVLDRILAADPRNLAASYYSGLLYAQTDRPDVAFRLWRGVVDAGDALADPHVRMARSQIEEAAFRAGITYSLPPQGGPSAADLAAAEDMDPAARDAMIRGMVAQLSDRLATQGGPVEEWARLIAAYGVLGDRQAAAEILAEARGVFGTSPAALDRLDAAEEAAGLRAPDPVPEAMDAPASDDAPPPAPAPGSAP